MRRCGLLALLAATVPASAALAQSSPPSTLPPSIVATTDPGLLREGTARVIAVVQERSFLWRLGQRADGRPPAQRASLVATEGPDAAVPAHGAWIAGSYTHTRATDVALGYDADTWAGYVGFDRALTASTLIGLSLGLERTDADRPADGSSSRTSGVPITLYLSHRIDDAHALTVSGSYVPLDVDTRRPAAQGTIRGALDGDRWIASLQASGLYRADRLLYGWEAEYAFSRDRLDGFSESDGRSVGGTTSTLQRVAATAVLGVALGPAMLLARLGYGYALDRDVPPGGSRDRDEILGGLDLSFARGESVVASFTANYAGGRAEGDSLILRALVVARF